MVSFHSRDNVSFFFFFFTHGDTEVQQTTQPTEPRMEPEGGSGRTSSRVSAPAS